MRIQLCKSNLMRQGGAGAKALLDACKSVGATPERLDCLGRCTQCERACIATIDGMPAGAPTAAELASQIAEIP